MYYSLFCHPVRYLQACMCQQISYIHWMEDIMLC
jgi:hypothetical protein